MKQIDSPVCPHCGYPAVSTHDPCQLSVGTWLAGRYQLGKVLGQGGFGITYLGWDTCFQRVVAIKEFFPNNMVNRQPGSSALLLNSQSLEQKFQAGRERFVREARAMSRVDHVPQIVRIFDFFQQNNTAYIVMEYIEGEDLLQYVQRRGGSLGAKETLRIMRPIITALETVHKENLIHRDISPDNIMLEAGGGVKLLDFGAVRSVENPDVYREPSHSTEAIVKHGYAPAEQYRSRGRIGPWTDVYALCATVYFCLTGTVPSDSVALATKEEAIDWDAIPGLSHRQRQTLKKGMAPVAEDRYRDMASLRRELFSKETPEKKKVLRHRSGKKKWIPAAIAAAALLLILAASLTAPAMRYRAAVESYAAGDYDRATRSFEALGDYRDSPRRALECRYALACQCMGQGDWEEAIRHFEELGTYRDSETMAIECALRREYARAEMLVEQEQYAQAAAVFEALGDYGDSAARGQMCRMEDTYRRAQRYQGRQAYYEAAILFWAVADYRDARSASFDCWRSLIPQECITADSSQTLAIRADGSAVAAGGNYTGECEVSQWKDLVSVSTAFAHTVGLKADGTAVAVGLNDAGQCAVSGWTQLVAVSAGGSFTLGLRADGTVVATGNNDYGQCDVSQWRDIVAIDAGINHSVGLKADGTVVAAGRNDDGQCDVSGWQNMIAVSAGGWHTLGLKSDGAVTAVGRNDDGQCNVNGWGDVRSVSAGNTHSVAIRADGTAVAVGGNLYGQCEVSHWSGITAIAAGAHQTAALKADGTAVAVGSNIHGQCEVADWENMMLPLTGTD